MAKSDAAPGTEPLRREISYRKQPGNLPSSATSVADQKSVTPGSPVEDLTENDVILRKRGGCHGNQNFRKMLNESMARYNTTNSRTEKRRICDSIISRVHDSSPQGRFLTAAPPRSQSKKKGAFWVVACEEDVRKRVASLLRQMKQRHLLKRGSTGIYCTSIVDVSSDHAKGNPTDSCGRGRGEGHSEGSFWVEVAGNNESTPELTESFLESQDNVRHERANQRPVFAPHSPHYENDEHKKSFALLLVSQQEILKNLLTHAWQEEEDIEGKQRQSHSEKRTYSTDSQNKTSKKRVRSNGEGGSHQNPRFL